MENNLESFIQSNSPDGGFLQSLEWRKFQEAVGRKTFNVSLDSFWANIIEHKLPIVGKYFYIPRGPVINNQESVNSEQYMEKIVNLAKENNAGWIRFDPAREKNLNAIRNGLEYKIVKAPHDMQPGEIFVMDITKPEEQLLAEMKSKTRYNIKLAKKKEVRIKKQEVGGQYVDEFLRLAHITACRNKITFHPGSYYKKMLETIPAENLKLYVAEYENKIIAANIMIFYGKTATYLHGASDDEYRNVMAPHILQWQAIKDAKAAGCEKYDFGGVKTQPHPSPLLIKKRGHYVFFSFIRRRIKDEVSDWAGITRFKTGFSPNTKPMEFPGSYDIVVNEWRYRLYRILQKIKNIANEKNHSPIH